MRRCSPKVSSVLSSICPAARVNPCDRDPGLIRVWGMGGVGGGGGGRCGTGESLGPTQGGRAGQTHPESQDPGGADPKVSWDILSLQEKSCLCTYEHWKQKENSPLFLWLLFMPAEAKIHTLENSKPDIYFLKIPSYSSPRATRKQMSVLWRGLNV